MERLDNPVWHALTGPQARFSEGDSLALRFRTDVSPFTALPDEVGADAWDALRALVAPGGVALVFRPAAVTIPDDWQVVLRLPGLQMVATRPIGATDDAFGALGAADVPEMLDLVERAQPGPFAQRTVELGTYLGRRADDGRLVAMAGERMHLVGYTEVSAVCTDASARKQGLATRLVRAIAHGIEARGETPILHVRSDNHAAIRVYEHLGFVSRVEFDAVMVRAPR